jgi:hypothetical protein
MQSSWQFCLELTLPFFLVNLSMAKPSTRSKVQARSHEGDVAEAAAPAAVAGDGKHTFCTYSVNTGNCDAVSPPKEEE